MTDGRAPKPSDRVEEIDDPFEAADVRRGALGDIDVATRARGMSPRAGGLAGPLSEYALAPPVRPGKIICVGRNYKAHAEEMGQEVPSEPLLFFKPSSALVGADADILRPEGYERVDMEAELVVVVGRRARNVSADEAWSFVAGLTLGNDVSNRDLQRADKQWTRAKGFDTFAPCGPFIRVCDGPPDPGIRIRGFVDEELRQDAPLSAMLFPIPTVIEYVSRCMTLDPGDLIYTGTPKGVSALTPGVVCHAECEGLDLGRLSNPVASP